MISKISGFKLYMDLKKSRGLTPRLIAAQIDKSTS